MTPGSKEHPAAGTARATVTGLIQDGPALSPDRLAQLWSVHVNTIYRDIRKGALPAYRLPGGRWRILVEDARTYGRPEE